MSAVYILAWLATATLAGWLVVKWHEASTQIDTIIEDVLGNDCGCDWCTDEPDPSHDRTGAAS